MGQRHLAPLGDVTLQRPSRLRRFVPVRKRNANSSSARDGIHGSGHEKQSEDRGEASQDFLHVIVEAFD